jgi:hypothetical protein
MEQAGPDLQTSPLSLRDDLGTVFLAPDRVFRAVHPEAVARTEALLQSGLTEELAARGLMPTTHVSAVKIPGSPLVLEHPRLPVVSYPYEWSYGMLRDAAALVLEINETANARGYELQDCHAYNIVFDGPRPQYVDLGSLALRPAEARGWVAREEFFRAYEYPLQIWADGGEFMARRLMAASELMGHADHGLYRWPWLRLGGTAGYERGLRAWHRYRGLSRVPDEKIRQRLPAPAGSLVCALKHRGWLPAQNAGLGRLRRRLLRRQRRGAGGFWSGYQGEAAFADTPRLRRVVELVRQSGATSVIELAGNQGRLSAELLRQGVVRQAVCTDAEERAVDQAHARTREEGGRLHTAVLDFIYPMTSPFGESPVARFRSDAAVALAVTHHLLLTQQVPVARVLRSIAAFARDHVFIEFMPRGLWDGRRAPPMPEWYTLDWFRAAFHREFEPWHEETVEENRHLFCGRLRR